MKLAEKLLDLYEAAPTSPVFQLFYKEKKGKGAWKKASLAMKDKKALEKNGKALMKQEGWGEIKVEQE
jgi:hypothetical protein